MAGAAELFTSCRSCGQQVSSFSTECPYCGTRLRRRAPRLERKDGDLEALLRGLETPEDLKDQLAEDPPPQEARRGPFARRRDKDKGADPDRPATRRAPASRPARRTGGGSRRTGGRLASVTRLRPRAPRSSSSSGFDKPWATIVLVTLSLFGLTATAVLPDGDLLYRSLSDADPWQYLVSALVYVSSWHQLAVLSVFGVFGWLWERRAGYLGSLTVVVAFVVAGIGGVAAAVAVDPGTLQGGAGGAAVALATAWILAELVARRRNESIDGDLIGATTMLVTVLLVCAIAPGAGPVAAAVGVPVGLLLGGVLVAARR